MTIADRKSLEISYIALMQSKALAAGRPEFIK
jgi:hypothetical protein